MSLLNRCSEHDHLYDSEGRLQGGLAALETLARVIALGSSDEREREPSDELRDEVEPALELPVTNPSRASSLLDSDDDMSDDPGSSDDDAMEEIVMDDESPKGHFRSGDDSQAQQSQTTVASPASPSSSPLSEHAPKTASQRSSLSPSSREGSSQATSTPSGQQSRRSTNLSTTPEIPVGERMKQCFLDASVLSTLLVGMFIPCSFRPSDLVLLQDLFFEFPWNNFLHSVVYDFIHQVLTGRVDGGLNRELTIALFRDAQLMQRIVDGQKQNDAER
jgi:serine/threonine-protein phosphatase 6 regulatory subunit 3